MGGATTSLPLGRLRPSSSSRISEADSSPIDIGVPTDSHHSGSVVKSEDGELHASEAVPPDVRAMLPSLKPAEISGPTGVQRHASVQYTASGELRANFSVPKEVLAVLPATVGAVDISAPTGVTKRGGVVRRGSRFDVTGGIADLAGGMAAVLEMLPTVANPDALSPASVPQRSVESSPPLPLAQRARRQAPAPGRHRPSGRGRPSID